MCCLITAPVSGQLTQVEQNFSTDPGWNHYQNRIVGIEMPRVIQDFGWRNTNFTGTGPGEIGGRVDNSRRQAYYAIPLGRPLTFDDELSASGKLAVKHIGNRGVAYIGFFISHRHTWRVWSSMGFRIWEEGRQGQIMFDWMSSDWQARGAETAILLDPDGAVHEWSFHYQPDAKVEPNWRDKNLEAIITDEDGNGRPIEIQGEQFLLEKLRKFEPDVTAAELRGRLLALRDQGLVEYFHRHDQHRWWKRSHPEESHGRVTLQFDNEIPYVFWFDKEIRNAPALFDRFGLFNIARFGEYVELYLGDLTINGEQIELSENPHWQGENNETEYIEPNFHGMQDYGWSQTNWAGKKTGEIGGLFWRTEPHDPAASYYADEIGSLTLEDPIEFSGSISFTDGMSDAGGYFGYFSREAQLEKYEKDDPRASFPFKNMMGFQIADRSSVGYNLRPVASDSAGGRTGADCGVFLPDSRQRHFTFKYDPEANEGIGRVTVTLDGETQEYKLTKAQRDRGALFDHFGLVNVRVGGHSIQYYLDDLSYTANYPDGKNPAFKPQTYVEVPYPKESAGRKY
ncbi:MAG: hypothetical protein CMJ46_13940 [Planctomyces sp.]|nr:hypothetical protein [Planctomyces sp.]